MIGLSLLFSTIAVAAEVPDIAVDGQLYRPPVDARATLWADDSTVTPGAGAKAAVGWVHNPVVWVWEDTGERVPLVGDAVGLNVIGSYAFWRIRAAVDLPLYLYAASDSEAGPGLGDLGIDVKGMILDPVTMPIGLGMSVRVDTPTGGTAVPLASDGVGWEAAVIADRRIGPVLLAANLGTRGVPEMTTTNTAISNQLAWRVGAGFDPGSNWGLSLDVAGYAQWNDLANAGGSPAEAMVGGWFRFADTLRIQAGAGHGISSGIGASNGRAVLALAWEPKAQPPKPVIAKPAEPPKPTPVETPTVVETPKVVEPAVVVAPTVVAATAAQPVVVSKNRLLLYQRVSFDGASLRAEGASQLDAVTRFLADHPEIETVRIEGHTDGRGDPSDELALAGTRAGIALEYLVKRGLARERFYAAGYGGMRPILPGADEAARIANERIEFVITKWAPGTQPQ